MKSILTTTLAVLASVVMVSVAQASVDVSAECIPQAEMKAIASHFNQFANLANADFCNDDSQNWHLVSSIEFMRKTQFSETMQPSKDQLFSGKFANNWYDYFIGRIDSLEVVNDCPKGVIAYVYMWGDKTMYTCPAALTDRFSSLDRASVMMHEARHIDGYPHVTCSKGARKGIQGACDTNISNGGSYAVTVETYAQLAKYAEGIHPAMKAYAKSSAVIYADEAFENPVKINRAENLLVLTKDLDFYSLNVKTSELKKLGQASSEGHIVKRGQHMIIFPTDKNLKAQYVFSNNEGEIAQSPMEFVSEYNTQTPEQKSQFVDLHSGAQWTAIVYKDKVNLKCDPRSQATKDINLPKGVTAASLIYPDGYARDKYTALLTTSTDQLFELGCVNKQATLKPVSKPSLRSFVKSFKSSMKLYNQLVYDQKYLRIHKVNSDVLGLADDGKIYKIESGRSTPIKTDLDVEIAEIVPQQSFEFFE